MNNAVSRVTEQTASGSANIQRNVRCAGREKSGDAAIDSPAVVAQRVNVRRALYENVASCGYAKSN